MLGNGRDLKLYNNDIKVISKYDPISYNLKIVGECKQVE